MNQPSPAKAHGTPQRQIDWDGLAGLLADGSLGPAAKWAFAYLWRLAGYRPGRVTISANALGAFFGATHRAALKWIAALEARALVELVDRDRRCGPIHLYVYDPADEIKRRLVRPDPQGELPGLETDDPTPAAGDGPADLLAHKGPDLSAWPDLLAPKGPAKLSAEYREPDGETPRAGARAREFPCCSENQEQEQEGKGTESLNLPALGRDPNRFDGAEWDLVRNRFVDCVEKLWPGRTTALAGPDRIFLLRASALVQAGLDPRWLDEAVSAVVQEKREHPIRYLRGVLANRLMVCLGVSRADKWTALDRMTEAIMIPDFLRSPTESESRKSTPAGAMISSVKPLSQATPAERNESRSVIADCIAAARAAKRSAE